MKDRTLTLQESEDRYLLRQQPDRTKPALTLRGNWLHAAGFSAGQRVAVTVDDGRITITPAKTG